jgi:anti-sigma B factor antagonist
MNPPLLTHTLDRQGDHVCLALTGELDLTVANQLETVLNQVFALHPPKLTVDLAGVRFIDTHSISLLVRACNATRADGRRFTVVDSHGLVRQVLQTMGLLDFLTQPAETPDATAGAETP